MKKVLVIGAGFSGCCSAHLLSENGFDVTLVERAPFLGGGCKTFTYGGHPFTYGPRHFLSPDEKLFEFLNQYVPMRKIAEHEFLTYIEKDQAFYNFPIHVDDIERMPDKKRVKDELSKCQGAENAKNLEEYWLASVGRSLYSKYIETYNNKMWMVDSPTEIDDFGFSPKGVALKSGPKACWTEAISAFPIKQNGYDDYFDIATKNVKVRLETTIEEFDMAKSRVKIEGGWHKYDIIVSTIGPETLMNNIFGPLDWIGRDFYKIVLPVEEALPENIYFLYYANQEPFTRIVEYKKFYRNKSDTTLIILEIPSMSNRLYPLPIKKCQKKAQKYLDSLPKNVFSVGRAGTYRYIDIDDIIQQAMDLVKELA